MDYEKKIREYMVSSKVDQLYKSMLINLFPELAESEDERIRKALIKLVKKAGEGYENVIDGVSKENAISWLEKQGEKKTKNECVPIPCSKITDKATCGEQKPADNVEPKFKVGDWIVYCNEDVDHITGIEKEGYRINEGGYIPFVCEDNVRLWTIQDAKDGDVLAYNDGSLTIFRYRLSGLDAGLYMSHIILTDKIEFKQTCAISNVHPATKEQRDQLEKAMADAGYTFDFEKKELRKIEQKPVEEIKGNNGEISPNLKWSEENELMLESIIQTLKLTNGAAQIKIDWLKSLRSQILSSMERIGSRMEEIL